MRRSWFALMAFLGSLATSLAAVGLSGQASLVAGDASKQSYASHDYEQSYACDEYDECYAYDEYPDFPEYNDCGEDYDCGDYRPAAEVQDTSQDECGNRYIYQDEFYPCEDGYYTDQDADQNGGASNREPNLDDPGAATPRAILSQPQSDATNWYWTAQEGYQEFPVNKDTAVNDYACPPCLIYAEDGYDSAQGALADQAKKSPALNWQKWYWSCEEGYQKAALDTTEAENADTSCTYPECGTVDCDAAARRTSDADCSDGESPRDWGVWWGDCYDEETGVADIDCDDPYETSANAPTLVQSTSVAELAADSRHSMGLQTVLDLNADNDGLRDDIHDEVIPLAGGNRGGACFVFVLESDDEPADPSAIATGPAANAPVQAIVPGPTGIGRPGAWLIDRVLIGSADWVLGIVQHYRDTLVQVSRRLQRHTPATSAAESVEASEAGVEGIDRTADPRPPVSLGL